MFAIITLALTAQTDFVVFAAASPFLNILARQSITPTEACESACTPLGNALTAGDPTAATGGLCTSAVVNGYIQCYDCLVAGGSLTQAIAQNAVNDYVAGCNEEGYTVSGGTVTPSSSSGSSDSSSSSSSRDSGSSSSNSGSSSGGSGLGSGSGFKSSGSARTDAGYLMVSFIFGLAAVVLRNS
ncbi:hypothetical protein K438DRAFT_1960901 [Mycena galopus ATCC 62051]|nr:hypothetical protein K438DRAFT_1960901 [Mycena galopus ATCC 62051]